MKKVLKKPSVVTTTTKPPQAKVTTEPKEIVAEEIKSFPERYMAGKETFVKQDDITFDELKTMVALGVKYPVRLLIGEDREDGKFTETAVVWVFSKIVGIDLNTPGGKETIVELTKKQFEDREAGECPLAVYTSAEEVSDDGVQETEEAKEVKPAKKKLLKKN